MRDINMRIKYSLINSERGVHHVHREQAEEKAHKDGIAETTLISS